MRLFPAHKGPDTGHDKIHSPQADELLRKVGLVVPTF